MYPTKHFSNLLELFLLREYPRGSFLPVSPSFYQQVMAAGLVVHAPVVQEALQAPFVGEKSQPIGMGEREKTDTSVRSIPTVSPPPPVPPVVAQEPIALPQTAQKTLVASASSLLPDEEEAAAEDGTEKAKWTRFFATHYPKIQIRDEIPSDALAKQQKELYRATVFLLLGEAEEAQEPFFQKIADAITARFQFALCLRRETWQKKIQDLAWREKKVFFLLSREAEIWLSRQGITLAPSLLFEPAEAYQQQPQKKAPLWQAICAQLCKLQK